MAREIFTSLNLMGNKIINFILGNKTDSTDKGQLAYDDADNKIKYSNGSEWKTVATTDQIPDYSEIITNINVTLLGQGGTPYTEPLEKTNQSVTLDLSPYAQLSGNINQTFNASAYYLQNESSPENSIELDYLDNNDNPYFAIKGFTPTYGYSTIKLPLNFSGNKTVVYDNDFVTTSTSQNISGQKNFTYSQNFESGIVVYGMYSDILDETQKISIKGATDRSELTIGAINDNPDLQTVKAVLSLRSGNYSSQRRYIAFEDELSTPYVIRMTIEQDGNKYYTTFNEDDQEILNEWVFDLSSQVYKPCVIIFNDLDSNSLVKYVAKWDDDNERIYFGEPIYVNNTIEFDFLEKSEGLNQWIFFKN